MNEEDTDLLLYYIENASERIYWLNPDGSYYYVNRSAYEGLGYSKDELMSMKIHDIDPNINEDAWRICWNNIKKKKSDTIESLHKKKDGKLIPVEINRIYVKQKNKELLCTSVREISDRKKHEQILKENQEKLISTLTSMDDLVFVIDKKGIIIDYHKPTGEFKYFVTSKTFKNFHYKDVLPVHILKSIETSIKNIEAGQQMQEFDYNITIGKEKKWFNARISKYKDSLDNYAGVTVVSRDITKRKEIEKAIIESEEKFRIISDQSLMGIIIIQDGLIKYYNHAFCLLSGYDCNDLAKCGKDEIFKLIYPDDLEFVYDQYTKKIKSANDVVSNYTCRGITKDKQVKWLELWSKTIKYERRNADLITFIDIDERKKAEEALKNNEARLKSALQSAKENEQKLKESNITKDKFFSIIAHDLKNPFNQFLGLSRLLLENFEDYSREELLDYIQLMNKISEKTNNLLENLLEWARSQTGRISYEPVTTDIRAIIANIISLFENQLDYKQITIRKDYKGELYAYVDENMIKSVFRNLISNAIKYTSRKGKIIIEGSQINNQIQISIIDTGVGIKNENIENIFRLDVQYTTEGTDNEKGTGLGLILCKEFIEINKGSVEVKSEENKGSKFSVKLPMTNK